MISDGKRSYPLFFMDKNKEYELVKNKAITPRLAFPFFLKTAEKKRNSRKSRNTLLIFWNDPRVVKIFSRIFIKFSFSYFYNLLTSGCKWMPTSIVRNLKI